MVNMIEQERNKNRFQEMKIQRHREHICYSIIFSSM